MEITGLSSSLFSLLHHDSFANRYYSYGGWFVTCRVFVYNDRMAICCVFIFSLVGAKGRKRGITERHCLVSLCLRPFTFLPGHTKLKQHDKRWLCCVFAFFDTKPRQSRRLSVSRVFDLSRRAKTNRRQKRTPEICCVLTYIFNLSWSAMLFRVFVLSLR